MVTLFNRLLLGSVLLSFLPVSVFAQCLQIPLRMNMGYTEAKQKLVDLGWQYESLPAYGYQETDEKVISQCVTIDVCNEYPEIDVCGSGHCSMLFNDHLGNFLSVTTYGDLESNTAYVTGWQLNKANNP